MIEMAKKLDTAGMMNDFGIGDSTQPEQVDKVSEIRRRRRKEVREKVHCSVYLSPDEYECLDEMARSMERPMTYVIKEALKRMYDDMKKC